MTDLRKAAEMALKVFLKHDSRADEVGDAVQTLRQALAQPDDFVYNEDKSYRFSPSTGSFGIGDTSAKREWVGLTDEEMKKTWYEMQNIMGWYSFQEISQAVEAKLKEKNT